LCDERVTLWPMRAAETDCHIAFRASHEDASALRRIAAGRGITLSALLREMVAVVVETEAEVDVLTIDELATTNVFVARARRSR
jgi:hypothetical protein